MIRALKERDEDTFFKNNRVLVETKLKKWHEIAMKKVRLLAEEFEENSSIIPILFQKKSQEKIDADLFDDEDMDEAQNENAQISKLDSELQMYLNLSKETYVDWRNGKIAPKHNTESNFFRLFWDDHKLQFTLLSKIAMKVVIN